MNTDKFDFFELDQHQLDVEWLRQPKIYHEYASKLAEARYAHEAAKTERDITMAELDRDIRAAPSDFGLEKITEGCVQSAILVQQRYLHKQNIVLKAKHTQDILQATVDALDHRKKALENLVQLHLADYFSSPKKPKDPDGREKIEELERKSVFDARKRLKGKHQ